MVEVQVDGQADVGRLSAVGRNYRIKSKLGNRMDQKPGQKLGDSIEALGAGK